MKKREFAILLAVFLSIAYMSSASGFGLFDWLFKKNSVTGEIIDQPVDGTSLPNDEMCSDSDGGVYSGKRGEVDYKRGIRQYKARDACIGSNVQENYCDRGNKRAISIECANECLDGMCLAIESESELGEKWLNIEPELKINDSRYCKDSDGGLNFYEPGKISVTGKIAWYSPFSLIKRVKELNREISDTCVSESILREYSCEKATGKSLEVECPDGCSEGACNLLIGDRVWKRGMQEEDIPPLAKKYYGKSQAEIEEMFKEGFSGRALTGRAISADYEEKSFELEKEDIIEPFSMELPIESLIVKNDICDNYDKKYKNYPQLKGREDLMIKWGNLLEEYYSYNSMYSVSKSDMQRLREIKGAIFAKIKEETANSIEFQRLKKKGQITPPYYYSTDIVALFDMPMIKYNFQSSSRQCVEEKEENSKRYSYGFIYNKPDKENDVVHKGVFEPDLNTGWTYVTAVPADNRGSFSFDKVGIRNAEDGIFEPQFKIFAPVADNLGGITGEMKLIYSQGKELRVIYRSKYSIPAQVLNGKEQVGLKEEITEYVTVFVKGGTIGGFFGEPGEQGSGTNPHEAVLAYIEHGLFATDYQLTALSKQRMRAYEKLIELKKEIQEVREELEAA